jgi:ABC-type Zn uptake system ZnuABC Zn-binding protein ZnuA
MRLIWTLVLGIAGALAAPCAGRQGPEPAPPLKVCATVPDLGDLARTIGGDRVSVTVFVKGTEDPHFLEAKPSFIKAASEADVLVFVGMELEMGWVPPILANCRNDRIQPGAPGSIDVSTVITPLELPSGPVDRSMGDVHSAGNPHYLTDPLNGLKAARLIADRLGALRPADRAGFDARYSAFKDKLCAALVGETLARKYDAEKLAVLFERGKLRSFLDGQGDGASLGGWLGQLTGNVAAVADHNLWPYFARRFGITIVGYMEPKPGVAPTTKHLGQIVEQMKRDHVKLVLTSPYFDPRHGAFVAKETGARVVPLAHQCGGQPGTDDYIAMCDYNVRQLAAAIKAGL